MPNIKVRAKKTVKALEDIFKKGDILTIKVIKYEKDTKLHGDVFVNHYPDRKNSKIGTLLSLGEPVKHLLCKAVYAEAGSYKDHTITTKKGKVYPSSILGTKTLDEFFEKI